MTKQYKTLRDRISETAGELVDSIVKIGKQDYFEISMKYVNGELITKTEFSDKIKIKIQ